MVGDKSGHVPVPAEVDIAIIPSFLEIGGLIGLNGVLYLGYLSCNVILLVD